MRTGKVINHEAIKNYNRNKILRLLSVKRQMTKQEIALQTNISIPTVANNIEALIEEGIVDEAGAAVSTGGRRAMMIRYLPDSRYSFGVDISPLRIRMVLSNLDGKFKIDESFPYQKGKDLTQMIKEIARRGLIIQKNFSIPDSKILGTGFALPGTVNRKDQILEMAPNLGIKDVSFKPFKKILRFPFFLENEANAGALAEKARGNTDPDLVYLSITRGVGCGIMMNGKLHCGKNHRAGEFGHMSVNTCGEKCGCGRTGCWELYVSEQTLVDNVKKNLSEKAAKTIGLGNVIERIEQRDKAALNAFDEYLEYLATGVENIILGIDPGTVVIGGEISRLGDYLIKPLRQKVFVSNNFDAEDDVRIVASEIGSDASIIGAAMLPVWDYLYEE
jgi:predicted NBD/HSP70 family sugar kinase